MRLVTVEQMLENAFDRADYVYSTTGGFVTRERALAWLNDGIAKLHCLVAAKDPDRYLRTEEIETETGTTAYELPDAFKSIRRLDRVDSGDRIQIYPGHIHEVDRSEASGAVHHREVRYWITGSGADGDEARINILPDPGEFTYEMLYVYSAPVLVLDSDVYDGVDGWERYAWLEVAARILEKAKQDSGPVRMEQAEQRVWIEADATRRDAGRAPRIADVRTGRGMRPRYAPP